MSLVSSIIVPGIITLIAVLLLFSKKDLLESFNTGATSGIRLTVSLFPSLLLTCIAASLFTASGAGEILARLLSPITSLLGIPSEILPFLTVRPISGSASSALLAQLFEDYTSDGYIGFAASVIAGSSDTLFYILAIYSSAAGVKNMRYAIPVGLLTMLFTTILACMISGMFV